MSVEDLAVNAFSGRPEHVSCPICVNPRPPRLIFKRSDGVGIWHCGDCDIMYASPRFSNDSLLEIYENEAVADLSLYDDWSYDRWKRENRDRFYVTQVLKHELLKPFLSKEDRILDVGCGTGLFSLEMSRHGYRVEGIEPSGRLVEIGVEVLNVPIHHGLLEDFKPAHRYKGIFVWDVLEHVSNPVPMVKRCHDLMEEEGYLFVQVPNYAGLSNRWKTFLCQRGLKKTEFKHFGFPWHIYAFNRKSMGALLKTGGFEPLIFESWSHLLKDGARGFFSKILIELSKRFCLTDYLTCVAQKRSPSKILHPKTSIKDHQPIGDGNSPGHGASPL